MTAGVAEAGTRGHRGISGQAERVAWVVYVQSIAAAAGLVGESDAASVRDDEVRRMRNDGLRV